MRALPIQVGGMWRSYGRTAGKPVEKPMEVANEGTTEGAIKAWETKHRGGANALHTPAWSSQPYPPKRKPTHNSMDPDDKPEPDITHNELHDASGDADYESGRAKIYTEGSHHAASRAHDDAAEAHRYAAKLHGEAGSHEKAKHHEAQASHHESEAQRTYPWLEKHLDEKHAKRMAGLKAQVANGAPTGNTNASGPHKRRVGYSVRLHGPTGHKEVSAHKSIDAAIKSAATVGRRGDSRVTLHDIETGHPTKTLTDYNRSVFSGQHQDKDFSIGQAFTAS